MVGELHWSNSGAGLGFTLLGVFCGITATVPAILIRRFGVRATLLAGGVVMAAAFACLAAHARLAALSRRLFAGGAGLHAAGDRARHLSADAHFPPPRFCLRALFHHRRAGRRGRAAALFLTRLLSSGWRDFWIVSAHCCSLAAALLAVAAGGRQNRSSANAGAEIRKSPPRSWSAARGAARPRNSPCSPPPTASF